MTRQVAAQDAIYAYNDSELCIIPANYKLSLYGAQEFKTALSQALDVWQSMFDLIIIDLPPTLGNFTLTALSLSHTVLIPVDVSSSSSSIALVNQLRTVYNTADAVNKELAVLGIVACKVDGSKICQEVKSWIREEYGDLVLDSEIRYHTKLAESLGLGESIFDYSPHSHGAVDYRNLADKVANAFRQQKLAKRKKQLLHDKPTRRRRTTSLRLRIVNKQDLKPDVNLTEDVSENSVVTANFGT